MICSINYAVFHEKCMLGKEGTAILMGVCPQDTDKMAKMERI